MAERTIRRRSSHLLRSASTESSATEPGSTPSDPAAMTKPVKRAKSRKPKERWLLTRKTWRYMADAGRKLIPDNAQNRTEDIPKIEAYFQEVCKREPRFLLWRKNSYPGALSFRRKQRNKDRRPKGGSCRKASSADEVDNLKPERPRDLSLVTATSGGRFDLQKMRSDFLGAGSPSGSLSGSFSGSSPRTFLRDKETFPAGLERQDEVDFEDDGDDDVQLAHMLEQYMTICDDDQRPTTSTAPRSHIDLNYQELIDKLQRHLTLHSSSMPSSSAMSPSRSAYTKRESVHFEGDHVQKTLSETLSRYFSQSTSRDRVVSDLLTNRKALETFYFNLRKTKNFRGRRDYASSKTHPSWTDHQSILKYQPGKFERNLADFKKTAPPPLIEIQGESTETAHVDVGVQTIPIPEAALVKIEEDYRKQLADQDDDGRDSKHGHRRRSSVDHDDVSQSVSDTIKRYLRMARKKSVDSDKADRFKRVNYDRNLRNIKAKGEITKPGDDDGLHKGCQTNDDWILKYRDLKFDECSSFNIRVKQSDEIVSSVNEAGGKSKSSAQSPGSAKAHHSFLSHLLSHSKSHDKSAGATAAAAAAASAASAVAAAAATASSAGVGSPTATGGNTQSAANMTTGGASASPMQKSKSSSSVMHHGRSLIAKKMFRSRSKSQTRPTQVPSAWTPQGSCIWNSISGRQVVLGDSTLVQLSEIERKVLQKVAIAKLQALNLGVSVKAPIENIGGAAIKPKRRPYLLKRKALTTGIFDSGRKDGDKDKESSSGSGQVFGIPLAQCVENERLLRTGTSGSTGAVSPTGGARTGARGSSSDEAGINRTSSRASFSSLIDAPRTDERGSCESLMSRDRIVGSVPGLLDTLGGSESTGDLLSAATIATGGSTNDEEPAVPSIINTCIRYLESFGLHTLGIFRVSTSKKRIRQLREDFDCGKDTFSDEDQNPHDVATLLKEYLRDLPDPLLCRDLYQAFIQTQRIRNRKLQHEALQHLLQLLPSANRDTLWTLLNFLSVVAKCALDSKDAITGEILQGNKMDAINLATVFAPNILHCIKPGAKDVGDKPEDRLDIINVVRTLIDHNQNLFTVSSELLDEVYVHMMDSHPEALGQLLSKRDANADESLEDLDSESQSNSAPWTPTALTSDAGIEFGVQILPHDEANGRTTPESRRTWSREEFLHESAATGGPNIGMRVRSSKEQRFRERTSKKRREESSSRRGGRRDDDSNSSASSITAMSIISRLRGSSREDNDNSKGVFSKTRSSSLDSNASVQTDGMMRVTTDDSQRYDATGVIRGSLTIPVHQQHQQQQQQQHATALGVNADDDEIPYIEDADTYESRGRQEMTIGVVRTPTAPPRRRQRSISGSDSSITSNIQPVTGSITLGYDSAMGSSATFSSPPHNTTPSSVSSLADPGVYSSPPSWASTPPTSPDSQNKAVNYIPDDIPTPKYLARRDAPILQRVSLSATAEVQQIRAGKPADVARTTYQKEVPYPRALQEQQQSKKEQYTPAITSIGNAVLRSRTADFERISKTDTKTKTTMTSTGASATTVATVAEKKKYTKRRYTDTRHPTRHIPDSGSLDAGSVTSTTSTLTSAVASTASATTTTAAGSTMVYKRKELIASVPFK